MDVKRRFIIPVLGLIAVSLMAGCFGHSYGRLEFESKYGGQMTVSKLMADWQNYDVYYAGYAIDHPSAVIFIPKEGTKTDVSDRWTKVEDFETLEVLVGWLEFQDAYNPSSDYPYLYRVVGPDDQLHGYMLSSWNHVLAKVVDDGTLRVYDLPLPPYLQVNDPDGDLFRTGI